MLSRLPETTWASCRGELCGNLSEGIGTGHNDTMDLNTSKLSLIAVRLKFQKNREVIISYNSDCCNL